MRNVKILFAKGGLGSFWTLRFRGMYVTISDQKVVSYFGDFLVQIHANMTSTFHQIPMCFHGISSIIPPKNVKNIEWRNSSDMAPDFHRNSMSFGRNLDQSHNVDSYYFKGSFSQAIPAKKGPGRPRYVNTQC